MKQFIWEIISCNFCFFLSQSLIVIPDAAHHLLLDLPEVREQVRKTIFSNFSCLV